MRTRVGMGRSWLTGAPVERPQRGMAVFQHGSKLHACPPLASNQTHCRLAFQPRREILAASSGRSRCRLSDERFAPRFDPTSERIKHFIFFIARETSKEFEYLKLKSPPSM